MKVKTSGTRPGLHQQCSWSHPTGRGGEAEARESNPQDTTVDRRHIDFIVEVLRNARLIAWNDARHLGPTRHWEEILEAVTAD
jgi:hypothetical protein